MQLVDRAEVDVLDAAAGGKRRRRVERADLDAAAAEVACGDPPALGEDLFGEGHRYAGGEATGAGRGPRCQGTRGGVP